MVHRLGLRIAALILDVVLRIVGNIALQPFLIRLSKSGCSGNININANAHTNAETDADIDTDDDDDAADTVTDTSSDMDADPIVNTNTNADNMGQLCSIPSLVGYDHR